MIEAEKMEIVEQWLHKIFPGIDFRRIEYIAIKEVGKDMMLHRTGLK